MPPAHFMALIEDHYRTVMSPESYSILESAVYIAGEAAEQCIRESRNVGIAMTAALCMARTIGKTRLGEWQKQMLEREKPAD